MSYTKSHWFSIEFIHYIVSGIGLIATIVKADTTLLSCIGLGRYFEVLEWLHRKRVCGDGEDTLLWTETKSDKFSVKEAFRTHGYNLRLAFLLGRQHGVKL